MPGINVVSGLRCHLGLGGAVVGRCRGSSVVFVEQHALVALHLVGDDDDTEDDHFDAEPEQRPQRRQPTCAATAMLSNTRPTHSASI